MATEDALTAHFMKNVARHETRIANAQRPVHAAPRRDGGAVGTCVRKFDVRPAIFMRRRRPSRHTD